VAINGERLDNASPFYGYPLYKAMETARDGDTVQLTVQRSGAPGEITLEAVLRPPPFISRGPSAAKAAMLELLSFYPLLFLMVGVTVLFLHLEDPYAWGLAVLFAAFIACAPLGEGGQDNAAVRRLTTFYHLLLAALSPAIFYYFFAVFPVSSAIDRRLPKLKSFCWAFRLPIPCPWPLCASAGGLYPALRVFGLVNRTPLGWAIFCYESAVFGLGFASLVWNSVRPPTPEARRKTRCAG